MSCCAWRSAFRAAGAASGVVLFRGYFDVVLFPVSGAMGIALVHGGWRSAAGALGVVFSECRAGPWCSAVPIVGRSAVPGSGVPSVRCRAVPAGCFVGVAVAL